MYRSDHVVFSAGHSPVLCLSGMLPARKLYIDICYSVDAWRFLDSLFLSAARRGVCASKPLRHFTSAEASR